VETDVEKAQKAELVTTLNTVFKDTDVIVVAHYTGLTVAQMTQFRRRMKDVGGTVKVAKNRLAKLALKGTDAAGIADLFKGPTVLAYSKDPVGTAKVATAFAKDFDKLVILGAAMGTTVLDAQGVKTLAELPSLDELRAKILGLIQAPAGKIARLVAEPGSQLARVIKAHADQAGGDQATAA
jgi:large subunit ribosomal protein L10